MDEENTDTGHSVFVFSFFMKITLIQGKQYSRQKEKSVS